MFPGQNDPSPSAPMLNGPQFSGNIQGGMQPQREQPQSAQQNPWVNPPQITVGNPTELPFTGDAPRWPNQPTMDGGGGFPGMFAPLPDLKKYLEGLIPAPPDQGPSGTPLI
jgi:hypothetical protein